MLTLVQIGGGVMKKILKIAAFVLLIALAVTSCYLMVQRTVEVVNFLKFLKDKMTEEAFKEDLQTRLKTLIFDIFPYLVNTVLLLIAAFSMYRGYSFKDFFGEMKSEIYICKRKKRERKLKRLKSKIKEIEDDE